MEQVVLGRTGLSVSVACLGAGGHSRLGKGTGKSLEESVAVVRAALDGGVNIIDTASAYGTEDIVGAAVEGRRDQVVISSKATSTIKGALPGTERDLTPAELRASLEASLRKLRTDHLDIFHLHAVSAGRYRYCREELVPELDRLRTEGKVRFFGITERFNADTTHEMLQLAVADDVWDVVMVGYNLLNQTASRSVFPATRARRIGTMCMFAVRWGLIQMEQARTLIGDLISRGEIDPAALDTANPLGFLLEDGHPIALTEAAYRFCRHSPGVDVVMTGTGDRRHLEDNLRAIALPPLPDAVVEKLRAAFAGVTSATGDVAAKVT
jgi:L-galactose dehydrogenase